MYALACLEINFVVWTNYCLEWNSIPITSFARRNKKEDEDLTTRVHRLQDYILRML